MIIIHGDYSDIERELDRLDQLPNDPVSLAALDAALAQVYDQTQAQVHVLTGRLKASGKLSTSTGNDSWKGEVAYGGPSAPYAGWEQERGGSHDFLDNLDLLDSVFTEAVITALRGH